jgi:hypothetical protein
MLLMLVIWIAWIDNNLIVMMVAQEQQLSFLCVKIHACNVYTILFEVLLNVMVV